MAPISNIQTVCWTDNCGFNKRYNSFVKHVTIYEIEVLFVNNWFCVFNLNRIVLNSLQYGRKHDVVLLLCKVVICPYTSFLRYYWPDSMLTQQCLHTKQMLKAKVCSPLSVHVVCWKKTILEGTKSNVYLSVSFEEVNPFLHSNITF